MSTPAITQRRGTSPAAAAASLSLTAPLTQAVLAPDSAPDADARTNNQPADATWTAPAGTIDADGIKNGCINSATDLTDAKHTLSGHVGLPETTASSSVTDDRGLNGVTVLMQFRESDGTSSPSTPRSRRATAAARTEPAPAPSTCACGTPWATW